MSEVNSQKRAADSPSKSASIWDLVMKLMMGTTVATSEALVNCELLNWDEAAHLLQGNASVHSIH